MSSKVIISAGLNTIDSKKSPNSKLELLVNIHKEISEVLTKFSNRKYPIGADDILPIFCYLFLHSDIKYVVSTQNYLKNFIDKELEKDQYGFMVMQFQGIVKFFITFNHESANMELLDYESKYRDEQEKLGVLFSLQENGIDKQRSQSFAMYH